MTQDIPTVLLEQRNPGQAATAARIGSSSGNVF